MTAEELRPLSGLRGGVGGVGAREFLYFTSVSNSWNTSQNAAPDREDRRLAWLLFYERAVGLAAILAPNKMLHFQFYGMRLLIEKL